jgi:tRNA A64-2'-O-ribosylphosphate transferase
MPDAFSKTVPIWCAVVNRVLFPEEKDWHRMQVPPGDLLSGSEVAQIEGRLVGFVEAFEGLGLDRDRLRKKLGKPMRLRWVNGHSTSVLHGGVETVTENDDVGANCECGVACHNVILCSASRRVTGAEISEGGYIQGAGDDSEGWSQGLTSQMFWRHKNVLIPAQSDQLSGLIGDIVLTEKKLRGPHGIVLVEPTSNLYIGSLDDFLPDPPVFDLVIDCHSRSIDTNDRGVKHLNLNCDTGKLGSRDLRRKLSVVESSTTTVLKKNGACRILITCETGKDLCIGVALMCLCLFFRDDGACVFESPKRNTAGQVEDSVMIERSAVDKKFIRQRLAWISCSKPEANPSRSTLQSVNAHLMSF